MASDHLTPGDDYYQSQLVPSNCETGNIIHGLEGNDTIIGNGYPDVITGDSGNDRIEGRGGNGNNFVEYLIAADGASYFDLASLIA